MSEHPKPDELKAVQVKLEIIAEFLEWISNQQLFICRWQDKGDNGQPLYFPATKETLERIAQIEGRSSYEYMSAEEYGVPNPTYKSWPDGFARADLEIQDLLMQYFNIYDIGAKSCE